MSMTSTWLPRGTAARPEGVVVMQFIRQIDHISCGIEHWHFVEGD